MDLFPSAAHEAQPLSVSELTARVKDLLEAAFANVWVTGEVSNFSRPRSGHSYLTLKDEGAQLPAVIWRSTAARVRFDLHDGLEVVCRGHVDVYPPRGRYQLIVQEIQPKGMGALELALRQLRDKLGREGLFDPQRKRPLSRFPRRVAVVTSPTGAAIRDFLEVLARRAPTVDVWVVPVRVQGDEAAGEIATGIELVNRLAVPVDCLVVTRGGGSLEDLWAFNEEIVVRAIAASRIPVISAVGHEIDVTLSDLVADVRALTPSEAAELVAPSAEELTGRLRQYERRLAAALRSRVTEARNRLDALASRRVFRRPFDGLHDRSRRLDELEARGDRALRNRLGVTRSQLEKLAAQLETLSPLSVLARGYSLTQTVPEGQIIRDATELSVGQEIRTRFSRGQATSRVERIERDE
jgi:exodeoxyribonuclease VII large subunit